MKRSRHIQLFLTVSGAIAGSLTAGCDRGDVEPPAVSPENTYTNNHYVEGAGYYHAPFRQWYPHPYNYYIPSQGYYYGGRWNTRPYESNVASSKPDVSTARTVNSHWSSTRKSSSGSSSGVTRGGFGSWGHSGGFS